MEEWLVLVTVEARETSSKDCWSLFHAMGMNQGIQQMAMTKVPKSYYDAAEKLRIAGQFDWRLRLLKNKK